ncbi:FkbM family methyltransferase [Bythopirellula polymerisocia]|uniref:FkbM family methyltransferase n=1 Tax=Bythopirellula polymerisocia TaxID=2528003 RepID=UPI0018D27D18|nr:FkbM family methyltransferase [Bythopirellula polymerisocia]
MRIFLGDHASSTYARSIYRDSHEAEEREIVLRNLADDDTVLECGAGLGLVTILCCRKIGSDRVHTLEANPALESVLRKNFALNHVSPDLQIKLVALEEGEEDFYVDEKFVTSSRFGSDEDVGRQQQKVPAVSLQKLLDSIRPTFLIMDIEGAEVDLADSSLNLSTVRKLCIEMHPQIVGNEAITRVVARLVEQGFTWQLRESKQDVLFFSRAA